MSVSVGGIDSWYMCQRFGTVSPTRHFAYSILRNEITTSGGSPTRPTTGEVGRPLGKSHDH